MGDTANSTPATEQGGPTAKQDEHTEGEHEEEYHGDTGGDEYDQYDYPEEEEDDRLELLPLLVYTVLVFTVGFAIGRCSRR